MIKQLSVGENRYQIDCQKFVCIFIPLSAPSIFYLRDVNQREDNKTVHKYLPTPR